MAEIREEFWMSTPLSPPLKNPPLHHGYKFDKIVGEILSRSWENFLEIFSKLRIKFVKIF